MLKKLLNDPFDAVDEMLAGFVSAHGDIVRLAAPRVVGRRVRAVGKVGLVIGGGSGHEPAFCGYVGLGLADAAGIGNVFAAPPADVCLDAIREASMGAGVLLCYGNYAGDVLNFEAASRSARSEGIAVETVVVTDDVASAPHAQKHLRRGIAGGVLAFKAAGAAAERGDSLRAVVDAARLANEHVTSIGVALSACEVPGAGRPTFELGRTEMEIGMGIHGEPGLQRGTLATADEVAATLVDAILADWAAAGLGPAEVALMVNGLGATAYLDLYVLYHSARRHLEAQGMTVSRSYVGEYVTSLEMAGASISLLGLNDQLAGLLDAPARSVRFNG